MKILEAAREVYSSMKEELRERRSFDYKVSQIYNVVGCSHHPENALEMIQRNSWEDAGITPDNLVEDNTFGIIDPKLLERLSPRKRVAYEILRKDFMLVTGLAYFIGRGIRKGFKPIKEDYRLDTIIQDAASDHCAGVSLKKAYSIEYPVYSTLDKVVAGCAGLAVSPIAFLSGLVYSPKNIIN